MAVRADNTVEDRPNDQLNHDVVQDRREGVQHRISEMLGSVKARKNPDLSDRAAYFDSALIAHSRFPSKGIT